MKKLILQRLIEVCIEEVYEVDEINDDTIQGALDYDYDVIESEVIWETQYDLGPYRVYDESYNLIDECD